MKQIFILIMVLFFVSEGVFVPRAGAISQGKVSAGFNMKRQHEAMNLLDAQWAEVKRALEKNDFRAASEGVSKMERTSADIHKFRLHRNAKRRDEFMRYNKTFAKNLAQLRQATGAEDQSASEKLMSSVEESCNTCHAKFLGGHSHH